MPKNKKINKGIFINAENKSIEWVEISDNTDIQNKLGCGFLQFNYIEIDDYHTIYLDKNGINGCSNFYSFKGVHDDKPIPKNGLILGSNNETGVLSDCKFSLDYVMEKVQFLS
jgi:hypothetical protein